jgi:outer membrane lipoprotein-sorting protein
MTKRKFLFATLLLLLVAQPTVAAMSARQIMEAVDDRDDGDNGIAQMEMILIDKNDHERKRNIRRFMKDKGEDTRFIMFFQSPADVKDTGFLTYDYDAYEKDDDQWLYLPALKKTKRIASSDKSGSFMGSDFNYSDMTNKNLDAYEFKILKEVEVRGDKCWIIEAIPQTQEEIEETGYKKSWIFVRQDNFFVVRAVHWTSEGGKIKYLDIPKLEQVDGIWVAREMTMTTKKSKKTQHKTILRFPDIRFNQDLDEGMFSIRRLEKGL